MGRRYLVTGAAGFIGSTFVRRLLSQQPDALVWSLDRVDGVIGRMDNLAGIGSERHRLVRGDICDAGLVARLFADARPDVVVHFAAESHVDRSIDGPGAFVRSNVQGTFTLLEAARFAWHGDFAGRRFHQVSTDEVFGDRGSDDNVADEGTAFAPRSPYAATKAAADHMVRAWHQTWGLPVSLTFGCNNLGPRQHPEKLVPLVILRALAGQTLPIYGDGLAMRRWLHVDDHADAILAVLAHDRTVGHAYGVGPTEGTTNLTLVQRICAVLDARRPAGAPHAALIRHVADRPGHDRCYHTSAAALQDAVGWRPRIALDDALARTVDWYLDHPAWVSRVTSNDAWKAWMARWYGDRG
ncbi:MAG: dTDP-glucose 4,6-dehydratase [Alphaproteobacteria bacterium]|nr:dTDP-glucose 4,6-dehydratase [Alphaproteobacteria bacterium]